MMDVDEARTPPAATRCPPELLFRIFEGLPVLYAAEIKEDLVAWTVTSTCPYLGRLAQVCRSWRDPAQAVLFHSVSLVRRFQVERFLKTARARPDLVARTRALQIGLERGTPEREASEEEQSAISDRFLETLMHTPNLRHLLVAHLSPGTSWSLADLLERLSLETLALKMHQSTHTLDRSCVLAGPEDVYRAFSLPGLRHYEVNFQPRWLTNSFWPAVPPFPSCLTSISVTVNSTQGLLRLITATAHTLLHVNIYTENAVEPEGATAAFGQMVNVREFRFESNIPPPSDAPNSWLQPLLPRYTQLKRLSVSEQAASASFLRFLPPSLELVEFLCYGSRPDYTLAELSELIGDPRIKLSLPELVLTVDEDAFEATVDPADLVRLQADFARRDIKLSTAFEQLEIPRIRFVDL